jgi:holo-[acyl-carrier protein] synthase
MLDDVHRPLASVDELELAVAGSLDGAQRRAHGHVASVGVDVVEIQSLEHDLELGGDRFVERIYTEQERTYCEGRVEQLATRFAAKEAIAKALGTGIRGVDWHDLEVRSERTGRPVVVLHGKAARVATEQHLGAIAISLCHTREHAVAVAIGIGERKGVMRNG